MKRLLFLAVLCVLPFALTAQKKPGDAKETTTQQAKPADTKAQAKPAATTTSAAKGSSAGASGQIVKSATVDYVKKDAKHFSDVILEGQLTHQLDDRSFIFTDSTGSIKIELSGEAEYSLDGATLLGSTVRALGVVKKRLWGDTVVEVFKLKIVTPSSVGGF